MLDLKVIINKNGQPEREIARSWKYFINERNYQWLCVVNIPKLLQKSNTYLHLAAETGQIDPFKTALSEEEDKNIKKLHFTFLASMAVSI